MSVNSSDKTYTPDQLLLDFSFKKTFVRDDFVISQSNYIAYQRVLLPLAQWSEPYLVLQGPRSSGKTHLAHMWAQDVQASFFDMNVLARHAPTRDMQVAQFVDIITSLKGPCVIENVAFPPHPANESLYMHPLKSLMESSYPVLITTRISSSSLSRFRLHVPDLVSRLRSLAYVELCRPDQALLCAVLTKVLHDQQVSLRPHAVRYLITRLPPSLHAVISWALNMNTLALKDKRALTIPFLSKIYHQVYYGNAQNKLSSMYAHKRSDKFNKTR